MSLVASETSPMNCRWITWSDKLPVCTRPPGPAHRVSGSECSLCEHWDDAADEIVHEPASVGPAHPRHLMPEVQDPLNKEVCPRCGSHDIVLMARDAVVQSFACSICHQRWLATRPWPLLRETRSRTGGHRHRERD